MSCFGCFGGPKKGHVETARPAAQHQAPVASQQQQPAASSAVVGVKAEAIAILNPVSNAEQPSYALQAKAEACSPPAPPWQSREELADIALRLADASGPWLERAQKSALALAESLGASLVSIWAFASDKSSAVVLASGGPLRQLLPQGYIAALAAAGAAAGGPAPSPSAGLSAGVLEGSWESPYPQLQLPAGASELSLQRLIAREAPFTWSAGTPTAPATTATGAGGTSGGVTNSSSASGITASIIATPNDKQQPTTNGGSDPPYDWHRLSVHAAVQHYALLPLRHGGVLAGALQICLGGLMRQSSSPSTHNHHQHNNNTNHLPMSLAQQQSITASSASERLLRDPHNQHQLTQQLEATATPNAATAVVGPRPISNGTHGIQPPRKPLTSGVGGGGTSPSVPNWLPYNLPDLLLLAPAVAPLLGGVVGLGGGSVSAAAASGAKPVSQVVVDFVSTLRRCDSICKLMYAVIVGLQDLSYRVTSMGFTATPLLLHRSAATAAIFYDPAAGGGGAGGKDVGGGGNTRSEMDRDTLGGGATATPTGNGNGIPQSEGLSALMGAAGAEAGGRPLRAHVTHLNHTLMLQVLTGADGSRYRRLYGGSIIQNCSEYMQDESNRGRDVSLCHRVGVSDVGSLLLAAAGVEGGGGGGPGGLGGWGGGAGLVRGGGGGNEPLLAVYLTSAQPLPEPLLEGLLAVTSQALKLSHTPLSSLMVTGECAEEWATLHDVHLHPSSVAVSTSCTPRAFARTATRETSQLGAPPGGVAPAAVSSCTGGGAGDEGAPSASGPRRRTLSFPLSQCSAAAPRSNLGMMVSSIRSSLNQVLSQRAALEAEGLQDDVNGVELLRQIGQGGQGVVFCGTLHGLEVAIKVVGTEEGADEVYDIDDEGAMIKLKRVLKRDATELAVTTSISHPNIVQVFSYFVDVMVVEYVGQPDRFRLLPKSKGGDVRGAGGAGGGTEGAGVTGPSNMIICMEYCDAGSLKQAVKRGCFRCSVPVGAPALPPSADTASVAAASNGVGRPAMQSLYTTLMEIALALRHLHALRLVHCDLKPSNVLLKSSLRDPRGWVCKLSDFGCVRLMSEPAPGARPSFNLEYAVGTPSFMAPEMFCKGHPLDTMVDIYSFGILMWEVYTGGNVYEGVPSDKLPYHVVKRGLRPAFPPDTPSAYRSLAQACWASDPSTRPSAAALVTVLQRLLSACAATPPQVAQQQQQRGGGTGSGVGGTVNGWDERAIGRVGGGV